MRNFIFACALALALPAAAIAQQQAPSTQATAPVARADAALAEVQHALAANWRPVLVAPGGDQQAAFTAACTGAQEEIVALNHRLDPTMTVAQFRAVRNPQGLIIIPTNADPASVVFFPNQAITWVGGGMGTLTIVDIDRARIDLRDSEGSVAQLQLAQAGGRLVLRLLRNDVPVAAYVACATTFG